MGSTTMARGLLMPSLQLMLMLLPILGSPMDTTDTATDSTGPTDTGTTADTSEDTDTGPMDIPTRIRILRQDFYPMDICPDTTQMCSESQSQNVESHLSKSS